MEKEIVIALGLIVGYFFYKAVSKKQKIPVDTYSDILTNDKYKVKGQYDK